MPFWLAVPARVARRPASDVRHSCVYVGVSGSGRQAQAQEAVFHAQYARLAGWAGALLVDQDGGHDIAAEAFVRLIARWGSANDPSALVWTIAAT